MIEGPGDIRKHWAGRSVLVTGATGLVGSWLIPALVRNGASVVAIVRDTAPNSHLVSDGWIDRIQLVNGSFSDVGVLRRAMAEYSVQTVFHLGAQTLVGVARTDPLGTMECNIRGTWNILEAARLTRVQQVLIASTVLVAGSDGPRGISPAVQLRQPYEVSKICAERIAMMFARTYQLQVGVVRCGNLYGGGDLNFSRLIPGAVLAMLRGERFRFRGDGKLMRDFLYVEDAVSGYMRLGETLAREPHLSGEPFTFGLGVRYAMLDVVSRIATSLLRSDLLPVTGNAPGTEISEQDIDSTAAREKLGWAPEYSLDEGIKRTVAWYQKTFGKTAVADPKVQAISASI